MPPPPTKPNEPSATSPTPASPTASTPASPPPPSGSQPPPPPLGGGAGSPPWEPGKGRGKSPDMEAAEAIYAQLLEVRRVVESLRQEVQEARVRRRLELVPVRVGDLMRGFQAAVARANLATRAGPEDSEDIEHMAIKNLEVSISAPVIDAGHAEDPVLMLPNMKSPDADTAQVSLKFTVVSVPAAKKGA